MAFIFKLELEDGTPASRWSGARSFASSKRGPGRKPDGDPVLVVETA
jgi:hypothetical protein